MYFYKNGKKIYSGKKSHQEMKFNHIVKENYKNDVNKCKRKYPIWVFIILSVIATLIAIWLVLCFVNKKS